MAKYLISATEVVNQGIVKGGIGTMRFDSSLIAPYIIDGVNKEIKLMLRCKCVGAQNRDAFFNLLKNSRKPEDCNYLAPFNGPLVTAYEDANLETLWVEHLFKYASMAVYNVALPFIANQVTSLGVMQISSSHGENQGPQGAKYIKDNIQQLLGLRFSEMVDYLCENSSNYPLFCKKCFCGCDGLPLDEDNGQFQGLVTY